MCRYSTNGLAVACPSERLARYAFLSSCSLPSLISHLFHPSSPALPFSRLDQQSLLTVSLIPATRAFRLGYCYCTASTFERYNRNQLSFELSYQHTDRTCDFTAALHAWLKGWMCVW